MTFEQLNQSISLNSNLPPSLYNTMHIIRSLFQDVEDAAEACLSQCPLGDEKLPQELVWLSKELISIYKDNSDALQYNRARLDSVMEKLQATQAELETFAEAEELLPIKEAEHRELEQKLASAKTAQSSYEKILEDIKSSKAELAGLQSFDFNSAEGRLQDLKNQILELQNRIRSLDVQFQTQTVEKSQLGNNVSQLHTDLQALQVELDRLAGEQKSLQTQKTHAEQQQRELNSAIQAARAEQAALEESNRTARQALQELERNVRTLSGEKSQLAEQSDQLRKLIEELNTNITDLRNEYHQTLLPDRQRLAAEKQTLLNEQQQLREENAVLTSDTRELNAELIALKGTWNQRVQERNAAQKVVDDYRRNELDPVIAERDSLQATEQQLQKEHTDAQQEITRLKDSQRELSFKIGQKRNQIEDDTQKYRELVKRKESLEQEQEELTIRRNTILDTLKVCQEEYEKLKNQDLPEAEGVLKDETQRRDDLLNKLDTIRKDCTDREQSIAKLNSDLPALQTKLQNLNKVYVSLTTDYANNNSDILDLERKIMDLQEQNDQERLDKYRRQLLDKEQHLLSLKDDCDKLQMEITNLVKKVETENRNRQILEERKRTHNDSLNGLHQLMEELKPWDSQELHVRTEIVKRNFETLQHARNALAESFAEASKQIADQDLSGSMLQLNKYETYLNKASSRSCELYRALCECAETLRRTMKEEPK